MLALELAFHTDEESLRSLSRQYWELAEGGGFVHSVASLASTFGVPKGKVQASVVQACTAFTRSLSCALCGSPRSFTSRAAFLALGPNPHFASWICGPCKEAKAETTARQAKTEQQQRFDLLRHEVDSRKATDLEPEALSLTDSVYLLALGRVGGAEDLTYFLPHQSFTSQFTPTLELDRIGLDHLYRRGVICVHPGSKPEAVVIEEGTFKSFYPLNVHWVLPLPDGSISPARFIELVDERLSNGQWPETWRVEAAVLHRQLALHESLQYLRLVLEEHGFDFNAGDKTKNVLKFVLGHFSIAQAYNFIWRAARDAAAFYVREATSRSHAANIVPGAIQRSAERALAEDWQVKAFRRDFRTPESALSGVLFTKALKLPEGGFTTVPPAESTDDSDAAG
jgi:hypothetical protein